VTVHAVRQPTLKWGDPPPIELQPQDSGNHPLAPWFGTARRERQARYAGRPRRTVPRRRAIITMVHNEPVFLPLWLRYYSRFFAATDIYVLDNETTDGSTELDGFVRIPVAHDSVDHTWMVRTIEQLQHELLERYELVVVTDVDEIIAPVPQLGTLGAYLDSFDEEWINCLGYELLHLREEAPLQLERPIMDQRGYWFSNDAYDKAALATVPMEWRPGFHGRADFQFRLDPDLRLIHLHRMDHDLCLERHRTRARRRWAPHDAREGWAAHNQITEDVEFERWFYEEGYFDGYEIKAEQIKDEWRGVF
jgi:hypothetical protein